ncbi:unnamed protein product [Lactuca virosa]|uniref:Uncharacterized protein n=1 Tax=Lactuca virosa TaxID=75947 RepID=A0AAU9LCP6_9ASTR|nr:unnamed protein product [Lactuca virosa]
MSPAISCAPLSFTTPNFISCLSLLLSLFIFCLRFCPCPKTLTIVSVVWDNTVNTWKVVDVPSCLLTLTLPIHTDRVHRKNSLQSFAFSLLRCSVLCGRTTTGNILAVPHHLLSIYFVFLWRRCRRSQLCSGTDNKQTVTAYCCFYSFNQFTFSFGSREHEWLESFDCWTFLSDEWIFFFNFVEIRVYDNTTIEDDVDSLQSIMDTRNIIQDTAIIEQVHDEPTMKDTL